MRLVRSSVLMAFAVLGAGCAAPVSSLPPLPQDAVAAELRSKRRLEAIEFSVFEATADVAFCG